MRKAMAGLAAGVILAGVVLAPIAAVADNPSKPGLPLLTELNTAIMNDERGPAVDVFSEASCAVDKGWIAVYIAFILALHEKNEAGAIAKETHQQIATWVIQMQNYIIDTADVEGACRAMVAARKAHGF